MTEIEIRQRLAKVLTTEPQNYNAILDLSSLLASFDKDNVRFTVDAGVIDRLGRELVARPETAVSELVKNSYDADAKFVKLTFENSDDDDGKLTIEDDGFGMDRNDLVNGFMKISSTGKIHEPLSTIYNRKRAGKKGIGRFSVQRLGKELTIITQTINSVNALKVTIAWEDYQNDKNLFGISNKIEEIPKLSKTGTTLIIDKLRDKWNEAAIKRIYRYVNAIIQPFPISKEREQNEEKRKDVTHDPGFKVEFFKNEKGILRSIANEESMIFKYAACVIEGIVDDSGMGLISVESERLNIKTTSPIGLDRNNTKPFKYLKQINFKAYYFIFNPDFIPPQQRGRITELSEEIGGIRLYKNGFRVLPYGEPYFDWLKLDESVRKRTILPVHGNHNFFGFVEVSENAGLLEETSSREGLHENEAFRELQNFTYRGLIKGVLEVASARSIKTTTNQKDWDRKFERPNVRLRDVAEKITSEVENMEATARELSQYSTKTESDFSPNNFQTAEKLKSIAKELVDAVKDQEVEEKKLIEEIAMLRVLASLGLTIGEFTHEIRHYLTTLEGNVKLLNSETKDAAQKSRITKLHKNIQTLTTYASYFDEAVSNNITRELAPQEVRDVLNNFINVITADAERAAITIVEPIINGIDLFSSAMHPSEWSSILFNLYTNSKKAIRRSGRQGQICVKAGRVSNRIYMEFADNGDGIPDHLQERVFDAFFTTSSPAGHFAGEKEEILGTGLGLKIVNDIISSYNGTIELVTPPSGYATNFRIEIPEASQEEIDNL